MSPETRGAFHVATDALIDAFELLLGELHNSAGEQRRASGGARSERRTRLPPAPPAPADDLTRARAARVLRRNGYREVDS
jgi:hypothetical protein